MTADPTPLKERLAAVESSTTGGGPLDIGSITTNWFRNPDGREAIERIEELEAVVAAFMQAGGANPAQGKMRFSVWSLDRLAAAFDMAAKALQQPTEER